MKSDLLEAVLLKTQKTWQTYVKYLCALNLGLLIDWLGGSQFLKPGGKIDLAGFTVVREALSATYGILFAVFIIATFFDSRLLEKFSRTAIQFSKSAELATWFLSPFSWSRWGRCLRIGLFLNGYFWLAKFTHIHLTNQDPPPKGGMEHSLYVGIGFVDLVILVFCLGFGLAIYHNLRVVRHRLEMIERETPDRGDNP